MCAAGALMRVQIAHILPDFAEPAGAMSIEGATQKEKI
jgi:hypothetical protein